MTPVAPTTRPAFWQSLAERGDATAVVEGSAAWSYAGLAGRVDDLARRLGGTRRLVLLEAANDLDTVVGYLACLAGGHPVLLVDRANRSAVDAAVAAYDPDVVLGHALTERRSGTAHDLHPELALLLSTSGSTGSPKLVRLSRDNVAANAAAIAESLQIRPDDRAATTLPLHYCYGLSVLASHLCAGAGVVLTDASVVEDRFWELVRRERVTTFPGVPHTFELLDRVGFADEDLPSLRYLTCAGGRLAPTTVRRYAELGRRRGFDLVVMYGATEATARMSYLPADLALDHPASIGVPVPGGRLHVEDGELVYQGPNVMLGYAESPADLALGREVHELRTGDLGRRTAEGLYEVTGRRARFAKVFGLRVDLDRVEATLRAGGVVGYAEDLGDRVGIAVDRSARPVDVASVGELVTASLRLPPAALVVVPVDTVPRLASGKVDHASLATALAAPERRPTHAREGAAEVYAAVLGRDVRPDDTFVSLGGDSLSYVEASLRLERVLGHLPADWHRRPVRELDGLGRRSRRTTTVETNVLLRAAAIVAIVGSHSNLFTLLGGAHLLVALAGWNFARFHLVDRPRGQRVLSVARSTARVVVPSVLWLTFAAATSWKYGWQNVLLLNGVLGSREWTEAWHYWFVEALVWTLVALAGLLALPWFDRAERRWPFWTPYALVLVALVPRYDVWRLLGGDHIHRGHVLFWLFALGWAAVRAPTWRHRLLVSATTVLTVPGFFEGDQLAREATIVVGVLLLVWVPTVRVTRLVARAAGVLAAASLYVYLVHWQVYPAYEFELPWLATGLSLAAGIAFWQVVVGAERALTGAWGRPFPGMRDDRGRFSLRRCPTRDTTTPRSGGADG